MTECKIQVGILFGGRSAEHEVSLLSARAVMQAIDRDRFDVIPIGVTRDGQWVQLVDPQLSMEKPVLSSDGAAVTLLPSPVEHALRPLDPASGDLPALDVIFPLIHGTFGEDGTVQGLFELAGIPYVGAGVLGSAVGMDKAVMKALFAQAGLPVAPWKVVLRKRWREESAAVQAECERELGYPLFVKPANLGSSVGISKVHDASEFAAALDTAAGYDRKLVVEQGIENAHEVEVSVLGNDELEASVPGEIVPCNEFYDYAAKYLAGTSELIIPAPLPEAVVARLQDHAMRAFRALDCAGLARVDFLVRRDSHDIFLLEANTLPGFTPISMYPKLWAASGLPYPALIERLIALALERHAERQANRTDFLPGG